MSYEGYEQVICEQGHYFHIPCSYGDIMDDVEATLCPICGAKIAWFNSVDETNGNNPETGQGYNFVKLEVDQPERYHVCKECKQKVVDSYQTYKIPEQFGIRIERIKRSQYAK